MNVKLFIFLLITGLLVFLTSCMFRENLFDLANNTLDPDIRLSVPGGGFIGEKAFIEKANF